MTSNDISMRRLAVAGLALSLSVAALGGCANPQAAATGTAMPTGDTSGPVMPMGAPGAEPGKPVEPPMPAEAGTSQGAGAPDSVEASARQYTTMAIAPLPFTSAKASVYNEAVQKAYDLDPKTCWYSGKTRLTNVTFNIAAVTDLTDIDVQVNPGFVYDVSVSSDGVNFTKVLAAQKNAVWESETKKFPAGTKGKAVRLNFNSRSEVWLAEVALRGGSGTSSPAPSTAPSTTPSTAPSTTPSTAPSTTPSTAPTPGTSPTPAPTATPPVVVVNPTPTPTPAPTAPPVTTGALYVATSGNDSNAGTQASPLRTINAAATRAKAGMTVMVAGGTYAEQVVTKVAGTATSRVTFQGYNGVPVIDGSSLSWSSGGNQNQGLVELRHPYTTFKGFKIVNSKNTGVLLVADNLNLENSEISNAQLHGISTHTSYQTKWPGSLGKNIKNIAILGNDVHHVMLKGWGFGQAISLIADGFQVNGNKVHDNVTEGIDLWLGAKHGEVAHNELYNNKQAAIYVDGVEYIRIHSNNIHNNGKGGIGLSSEATYYDTRYVWVYNNKVYDNVGEGCFIWDPDQGPTNVVFANNTLVGNKMGFYFAGSGISGSVMNNLGYGGSLVVNEAGSGIAITNNTWQTSLTGFVNPGAKDYHLAAGSPAVNKGQALPVLSDDLGNRFTISTDYDGRNRVNGGATDLGAFEQ